MFKCGKAGGSYTASTLQDSQCVIEHLLLVLLKVVRTLSQELQASQGTEQDKGRYIESEADKTLVDVTLGESKKNK